MAAEDIFGDDISISSEDEDSIETKKKKAAVIDDDDDDDHEVARYVEKKGLFIIGSLYVKIVASF